MVLTIKLLRRDYEFDKKIKIYNVYIFYTMLKKYTNRIENKSCVLAAQFARRDSMFELKRIKINNSETQY